MLQLYFANIDFLFVLFHVSLCCLLACFSLNTFRCLFSFVLLLSRENLNMHFVPFINTFTLFFWFVLPPFFHYLGSVWVFDNNLLSWIVSKFGRVCVCLVVWMQLGTNIYDLRGEDSTKLGDFNNVLAKIRNSIEGRVFRMFVKISLLLYT